MGNGERENQRNVALITEANQKPQVRLLIGRQRIKGSGVAALKDRLVTCEAGDSGRNVSSHELNATSSERNLSLARPLCTANKKTSARCHRLDYDVFARPIGGSECGGSRHIRLPASCLTRSWACDMLAGLEIPQRQGRKTT
jgi:hypothetical protein